MEKILINDKENNIKFPLYLMYNNKSNTKSPLVLISHGSGGNPLIYNSIAKKLLLTGYFVAMIEHYKNNKYDNEYEKDIRNLEYRPKHLSLVIDKLYSKKEYCKFIDFNKISVIGHSMGGYTALAIAGGRPYTKDRKKIDVNKDNRVKSIVLMAPATGFFNHPFDSLTDVNIPVLFFSAEKDYLTYATEHTNLINNQFAHNKQNIEHIIVEGAGHFSFLDVFPKILIDKKLPPAIDPEGFDRRKFNEFLSEKILDFLEKIP